MLVDSMTHEEVYQELARDRDAVSLWWEHQLSGLRRTAMKSKTMPRRFSFDYTSTRRIRYLFVTTIFDKRMRGVLTGMAALRLTKGGLTVYAARVAGQMDFTPIVMLPHMWQRYAERAHLDLQGFDLVRHFFQTNVVAKVSWNQDVVGRSVRYKDMLHRSLCTKEGVLLGQLEGRLFIARTFITYDMCSGLQEQDFNRLRSSVPSDKEFFDRYQQFDQQL